MREPPRPKWRRGQKVPTEDVAVANRAMRASVLSRLRNSTAKVAPGAIVSAFVAMAATFVTEHFGGPVMLYALLFGIAVNFLSQSEQCAPGITWSAKSVLRLGVAMLGIQVTLQDLALLGVPTVVFIVAGVCVTIVCGSALGRMLKLPWDHAVLSSTAVAICGASAALAVASVLPTHKHTERNTVLTVVGVTTLSTIAMLVYPMIANAMQFTDRQAGIFLGATIHDVAQVIGAGYMISDEAGRTAATVKLMRVACLVPAVMLIALCFRSQRSSEETAPIPLLPAFLVGFVVLMLINSAGFVPASWAEFIAAASRWCLIVAVAALGVKTSLKDLVAVGPNPVAALVLQTLLLGVFGLLGLVLISHLPS